MSPAEELDRANKTPDLKPADAVDVAIDAALDALPVSALPSGFVEATMTRVTALKARTGADPAARGEVALVAATGGAANNRRAPAWAPSAWEFALPVALVGALLVTLWQLWWLLPPPATADPRWLAEIEYRVLDTWSRWAMALMLTPTGLLVVVVGVAALAATSLPRLPMSIPKLARR